ncbi:hypothetical protein [uncultured Gammaproteobacteria bacterium]|nr:hypothetical protein [uncultured Gammaproteobacteria bacterium]CAC9545926.1 hypothetical protein [uncultured Gammaproteobacteria bacterium]
MFKIVRPLHKTIQPISELDANSKALTFIQAGIASGKSIDSRLQLT